MGVLRGPFSFNLKTLFMARRKYGIEDVRRFLASDDCQEAIDATEKRVEHEHMYTNMLLKFEDCNPRDDISPSDELNMAIYFALSEYNREGVDRRFWLQFHYGITTAGLENWNG